MSWGVSSISPSDSCGLPACSAVLIEYLERGVSTEVPLRFGSGPSRVRPRQYAEVVRKYKGPAPRCFSVLLHGFAESHLGAASQTHASPRASPRGDRKSILRTRRRSIPKMQRWDRRTASIFAPMLLRRLRVRRPKDEGSRPRVLPTERGPHGATSPEAHETREKGGLLRPGRRRRNSDLHAEILLFEGADGPGREPFLLALHGSPNFTTAGLLNRPPSRQLGTCRAHHAASQTQEHVDRRAYACSDLDRGFTYVGDLGALHIRKRGEPPRATRSRGVADTTYPGRGGGRGGLCSLRATPAGDTACASFCNRDGA